MDLHKKLLSQKGARAAPLVAGQFEDPSSSSEPEEDAPPLSASPAVAQAPQPRSSAPLSYHPEGISNTTRITSSRMMMYPLSQHMPSQQSPAVRNMGLSAHQLLMNPPPGSGLTRIQASTAAAAAAAAATRVSTTHRGGDRVIGTRALVPSIALPGRQPSVVNPYSNFSLGGRPAISSNIAAAAIALARPSQQVHSPFQRCLQSPSMASATTTSASQPPPSSHKEIPISLPEPVAVARISRPSATIIAQQASLAPQPALAILPIPLAPPAATTPPSTSQESVTGGGPMDLDTLTRKFRQLIESKPSQELSLTDAMKELQCTQRKILDIVTILEDIGVLSKKSSGLQEPGPPGSVASATKNLRVWQLGNPKKEQAEKEALHTQLGKVMDEECQLDVWISRLRRGALFAPGDASVPPPLDKSQMYLTALDIHDFYHPKADDDGTEDKDSSDDELGDAEQADDIVRMAIHAPLGSLIVTEIPNQQLEMRLPRHNLLPASTIAHPESHCLHIRSSNGSKDKRGFPTNDDMNDDKKRRRAEPVRVFLLNDQEPTSLPLSETPMASWMLPPTYMTLDRTSDTHDCAVLKPKEGVDDFF